MFTFSFCVVSSGCDQQNLGGHSADGAPVLGMKASHCVLLTKDPFHMNQVIQLRDVTIWICNFLSTEGLYFNFFFFFLHMYTVNHIYH